MAGEKDGPTVIQTGSGGGSGWFIAALILVAVLIGGYFLFNADGRLGSGGNVDVKIEAPKADAPATDTPTTAPSTTNTN